MSVEKPIVRDGRITPCVQRIDKLKPMKIIHIDASARNEGSYSREMSAYLIASLRSAGVPIEVDRLDLAVERPKHLDALATAAITVAEAQHTPQMREAISDSDALVERVVTSDALVIGTPIYNFGMPSTLKAFFDHISRNGRTFVADDSGMRGLLADKKVAVLLSAGGAYGTGDMFEGMDCLTPHVRTILGFLGVQDVRFIAVRPTMYVSVEAVDASMKIAKAEADALARAWSAP